MPQGIFYEGLNQQSRDVLFFEVLSQRCQFPFNGPIKPAHLQLDVVFQGGPFIFHGAPSFVARLDLVFGEPVKGLEVSQGTVPIKDHHVVHDAIERIENEVRIHEPTQRHGLHPV